MANVFDYLAWRGDLSFTATPFCEADSLVLCRLVYLPFDGIVPSGRSGISLRDAARRFLDSDAAVFAAEDRPFLEALRRSERFGPLSLCCYVSHYDENMEKQFAALTVCLNEQEAYVAYRGTDNTLVGWKEDFNLAFLTPIPAQEEGLAYLQQAGRLFSVLRVGGHSKGGNIAVYASAYSDERTRARIIQVFNHDGPGFGHDVFSTPGYRQIKARLHTFVPQSSVIGMLLDHEEDYTIVHSTQTGLMQHDLYSWEISCDHFIYVDKITAGGLFIDRTFRQWISAMSREERETFVDALYRLIRQTNARTLDELSADWRRHIGILLRSFSGIDDQTRDLLRRLFALLVHYAGETLAQMLPKPGKGEFSVLREKVVPFLSERKEQKTAERRLAASDHDKRE